MIGFFRYIFIIFILQVPLVSIANAYKLFAQAQFGKKNVEFDIEMERVDKKTMEVKIDHVMGSSQKIKITFLNKDGTPFFPWSELREEAAWRTAWVYHKEFYEPEQITLRTEKRQSLLVARPMAFRLGLFTLSNCVFRAIIRIS